MKNYFKKINTYSFWVALSSAILILVQVVGRPLGLEIDEEVYMSVVNSVLGIFVLIGIVPKGDTSTFCEDSTNTESDNYLTQNTIQDTKTLNLDEDERQLLISYQRTNS